MAREFASIGVHYFLCVVGEDRFRCLAWRVGTSTLMMTHEGCRFLTSRQYMPHLVWSQLIGAVSSLMGAMLEVLLAQVMLLVLHLIHWVHGAAQLRLVGLDWSKCIVD